MYHLFHQFYSNRGHLLQILHGAHLNLREDPFASSERATRAWLHYMCASSIIRPKSLKTLTKLRLACMLRMLAASKQLTQTPSAQMQVLGFKNGPGLRILLLASYSRLARCTSERFATRQPSLAALCILVQPLNYNKARARMRSDFSRFLAAHIESL